MAGHTDPQDELRRPAGMGLTHDQALALADAISEDEDLALAVSAYEAEDGSWAIEATLADAPDIERFQEIARQTLGGEISFAVDEIDTQTDWVKQTQEGLAPVHAGGFFIHGSHDRNNVPAGARAIQIDAAQAFGTGHHGTTTGCLDAIEYLLRRHRPRHIIDVGTGSGVLAIALAMRLRQPVVATDIDPVAVRIARQNAVLNGVGRYVRPFTARGVSHHRVEHEAPYDLVVANILARPLVRMAGDIAELTAPGGHIILSGLLNHQANRVLAAYRNVEFTLKRRLSRGDWATLIMRKG